MPGLKNKILRLGEDLLLILAVGVGGQIILLSLKLIVSWTNSLVGETNVNSLMYRCLEFIHFAWTVAMALLFAIDSIRKTVIIVISGFKNEK